MKQKNQPKEATSMNRFWNWVKNEDTGQRELWLEGVIAEESWWGDEYTPALFKEELFSGDGPILLHVNSPGGDCIAASQIYTMLMDYPYDVTVQIDGIAASAASVIAMAGTRVLMSPTSLLMVHNPWTSAVGDVAEMQKAISMLDEVKESIINAYEIKTGLSRARISHIMDAETWMNANKAKELGFCDEILFEDEHSDEPAKPDFIFSSRLAALQLMNKIMGAVPHEALEEADREDTASTPEATVPQPDTPDKGSTADTPQPDTVPAADNTTIDSAMLEKLRITMTADQLRSFGMPMLVIHATATESISPEPAPEPQESDHRVKAADLEKRLSLLK